MATGISHIVVTMDIESVSKLKCLDSTCRFNLCHDPEDPVLCCGLKRIEIGLGGACALREADEDKGDKDDGDWFDTVEQELR